MSFAGFIFLNTTFLCKLFALDLCLGSVRSLCFQKSFKRFKKKITVDKKRKALICLSLCYFCCHKWHHYWISSQFCKTKETGLSQDGIPEQSLIRLNLIIAPTTSLSQGSPAAGEERYAPWSHGPLLWPESKISALFWYSGRCYWPSYLLNSYLF